MGGLWSVARQTFFQIVRTKTAWVFILVLTVLLVALPHNIEGDGTLAGKIRAFLSYSTTVTAITLSILTLLLAVDVVASDVRRKTVFSVVCKPVARWQYILGRWVGIVMLDGLLLVIAAVDIYMVSQDLRGGQWRSPMDRLAVETEVFTARARIKPVSIDEEVARRTRRRIETFRRGNPDEYERVMGAMISRYGDEQTGLEKYRENIARQERKMMESVGPGGTLTWTFEGLHVEGESLTGTATVLEPPPGWERKDLLRFEADRALVGRLLYRGPVRIGSIEAIVAHIGDRYFDAAFTLADAARPEVARLKPGSTVDILIDPTLQLSFKAKAGAKLPGNLINNSWHVSTPDGKLRCYYLNREDPPNMAITIAVPGRAIRGGKTVARFFNQSPASITILHDDVSVLTRVGNFTGNFVRVMILILCQLMFLAALGVLAASFLSFPVACVLAFGLLPFSLARGFLNEALKMPRGGWGDADVITLMGHVALKIMSVPLPDFAKTNRSDALVDGMAVTWSSLGETVGFVVAIQAAVILALACLIFTKRELAAVQVA